MITAVDTAVLVAIDQAEPEAGWWVDQLAEARLDGGLAISPVVAAEFFAVVMDERDFDATLADLGIEIRPFTRASAMLAGQIFRRYRDAGGPRQHMVPDFLIAAHAAVDCGRLASPDRGYLRRYFPHLHLIKPS